MLACGDITLRFVCCPAAVVVARCRYASAQMVPLTCATAQNLLRRMAILENVNFRTKTIVQNASVHTGKESVDYVDGLLVQTKRVSK